MSISLLQFLERNRLDELFRRRCRNAIEFRHLRGCCASSTHRFTFANHLTHQADLLRLRGIEAPPRKQQIANDCVSEIPLQPRDSTEPRNEAQSQFGEAKTSSFVCDDEVAG